MNRKEKELLKRKIFSLIPSPICIINTDGTYLEVNEAFCEYFGLSRKNLIGKTPVEAGFINKKMQSMFAKQLREKGFSLNIAVKIKTSGNHIRFMLFNTKRIRLNKHFVYVSVGNDISDFALPSKARQSDIVYKSLNSITNTGIILVRRHRSRQPLLFYRNREAENVLKKYSFRTLLTLLSRQKSVYLKTAAGIYQIKEIPVQEGSPLGIVLMERLPDATCMKEKLRQFDLTPRQKEIAVLAANGHSNREIAAKLCLSEYTIKDHLKAIFNTVGVRNRSELCPKLLNLI